MQPGHNVNINVNMNAAGVVAGANQANAAVGTMAAGAQAAGTRVAAGMNTATAATQATAKAADTLGKKAGDLGGKAQKLGGALGGISPAAGGAAMALADMGDVIELGEEAAAAMGMSLGTLAASAAGLAAAVGAVYLLYKGWNRESERSAEIQLWVDEATKDAKASIEASSRALVEMRLNTTALTDAQKAGLLATYDSEKALAAAIGQSSELYEAQSYLIVSHNELTVANTAQTAASLAQIGAWSTMTLWAGDLNDKFHELVGTSTLWGEVIDLLTNSTKDMTEEVGKERGRIIQLRAAALIALETQKAKIAQDEQEKAATEAKSEAERAYTESLSASAKALDEYMDRAETRRVADVKSEEDHQGEIKAVLEDGAQAAVDAANWEVAQVERTEQEKTEAYKSAAEAKKEADEEARRATQEAVSLYASATGAISSLADILLANQLDNIDTSTEAGKQQAMAIWEQQKGLAIATATIQAVLAVAMAVASAPPPANIPAIAANTIAGAAQVALAIAAPPPKLHKGGFLAPDEQSVTMTKKEAMLSGQGRRAFGDGAINAANAGRAVGGPNVTQIVYKHKAFNYFVADNLQTGGALAKSISRGDRIGQPRRGRGA